MTNYFNKYSPNWPLIAFIVFAAIVVFLIYKILPKVFSNLKQYISDKSIIREMIDAPKWHLISGTIFVIIGILILISSSKISLFYKLLGALVTEIGFALIIAFVLHVTVELHAKIEHDKQISRGLLSYIYDVNLNNDMFLLAERHILKAPFLRSNLQIEYDFLSLTGGIFQVKYTVEYLVENVSSTEKQFIIKTFVEKAMESDNGDKNRNKGLQRITVEGQNLQSDDLDNIKSASFTKSPDFIVSEHAIDLPPGQSKRIECVHLIEKFERDSELWRSVVPCSGVSLKIKWKPEFNILMTACPIHPADVFDSINIDEHCTLSAKLFQPFFPHNGVHFWWGPKPA
jgi:hypothetical protein